MRAEIWVFYINTFVLTGYNVFFLIAEYVQDKIFVKLIIS